MAIQQSVEEVAEAMKDDPISWAENYLHLKIETDDLLMKMEEMRKQIENGFNCNKFIH